jgi:HPt (histidine-containing phosphotransfer) domain-containing protein
MGLLALWRTLLRAASALMLTPGCPLASGRVRGHLAKPTDQETLLPISDEILALVPQYLASKDKQIEEVRAALASGDFGPVRRFGHNLKGTGRGYGFPPIEEMGREIEQAAIQADAGRIADQLAALHRFVGESAAALAPPK